MAGSNPPRMGSDEFETLFKKVCNWGRWGPDDQLGALNLIGPEQRRAAAALVREGIGVNCSHPLNTIPDVDNSNPVLHFMIRSGDAGQGSHSHADFLGVAPHGLAHTHLDALCHFFFRGQMYNGRPIAEVTSMGTRSLSVGLARDGIVSRGVLLDVADARGGRWLEPGDTVMVDELEAAEAAAGLRVGQGDVLLVHTGRRRRQRELGVWDSRKEGIAVLHASTAAWIHDRGVAVVGSDGGNDSGSTPVCEAHTHPVHVLCLVAMGVMILDNCQLEDLAAACAPRRRWEFMLVVAPLRLEAGTASLVNPIAIF